MIFFKGLSCGLYSVIYIDNRKKELSNCRAISIFNIHSFNKINWVQSVYCDKKYICTKHHLYYIVHDVSSNYGLCLIKFVHTNLIKARFELRYLGSQAGGLPERSFLGTFWGWVYLSFLLTIFVYIKISYLEITVRLMEHNKCSLK